jgi:serine/threonine protein kinase
MDCFYLLPRNEEAKRIVEHPRNRIHRTAGHGNAGLTITLARPSKKPHCLATFGRLPVADVYLEDRKYAKEQCVFTIHRSTGELLLHDTSRGHTTHLQDKNVNRTHWLYRPKQGVVQFGPDNEMIILEIADAHFWLWPSANRTQDLLPSFIAANPEPDTEYLSISSLFSGLSSLNTAYATRVQTPAQHIGEPEIVPSPIRTLGQGTFGTVDEVVDLYTGEHYARKVFRYSESIFGDENTWRKQVKKEVELHARLKHVSIPSIRPLVPCSCAPQKHIVTVNTSQGWKVGQAVEMFMPVYEGNAITYFSRLDQDSRQKALHTMVRQILSALSFMHGEKVFHRDVKPGNILQRDGNFYICDFSVAKMDPTCTLAGTYWYMAPELFRRGPQTAALDVYSFGVTLLECMGLLPDPAVRPAPEGGHLAMSHWHRLLLKTAQELVPNISRLLALSPDQRPTVNELLASSDMYGRRFPDPWAVQPRSEMRLRDISMRDAAPLDEPASQSLKERPKRKHARDSSRVVTKPSRSRRRPSRLGFDAPKAKNQPRPRRRQPRKLAR